MSLRSSAATFALLLAVLAEPAARGEEPSLPGGAASLRETHGDWQVFCAIQTPTAGGKSKMCVLSQEQFARETRQRALAIELRPEPGKATGLLILPFGLALAKGATHQVDDGATSAVLPFRTCLPVGCLVDLDFDASATAALKSGKILKVKTVADDGQSMTFAISLAGYASAHDRASALME